MTIKTWTQRLRDNREGNLAMDALAPPTHHEVKTAMYEEITALRAELEKAHMHIKHIGNDALRSENAALHAELAKIKAQRCVLAQALEALQLPSMKTEAMLEQRDAAISAIQEVLK